MLREAVTVTTGRIHLTPGSSQRALSSMSCFRVGRKSFTPAVKSSFSTIHEFGNKSYPCSNAGFVNPPRMSRFSVSCSGLAEQPDKARGGLPRFHVETLPPFEGMVARVEGDEFWHMIKVLRLKVNDRVELFNGRGGIMDGRLLNVNRSMVEVIALENQRILSPTGPNWHVAAAFCTLKGGRGEWLVEKCTELGARTLTPLLTERSSSVSGGRSDRWQRMAMAATKQCQRLHTMEIQSPVWIHSFLSQVPQVDVALVAAAESPPLFQSLAQIPSVPQTGLLFVGPEGDFTEEEFNSLIQLGARPVGLGPRRLRVETATIALLATAMLMGNSPNLILKERTESV